MTKTDRLKNAYWKKQGAALRDPAEVLCAFPEASGVHSDSLRHTATDGFTKTLKRLNVTLFVTREYEHLVMALTAGRGGVRQSFVHLPHPSGLAVDRKTHALFVAATRNPNQIWEFRPVRRLLDRADRALPKNVPPYLLPHRTRFLAGAYYLHDLAVIGGRLYGNSVGQNAVAEIGVARGTEKLVWWPSCVVEKGKARHHRNYIQLNSIAAGPTIRQSFFSASGDCLSPRRPGHLNYPVDARGVIFDGRTGGVIARGLTRPHSARLARGKLWVDNSGYGEFGYVADGGFHPIVKFPAWTRGLCIVGSVAFVGVSRVLPKFARYAPGLKRPEDLCGVYAVDLNSGKVLGSIRWPHGNQIFAIDWMDARQTPGFIFEKIGKTGAASQDVFYAYQV